MDLNPKQRQFLKGIGHSLKPVIQVGKDGLSEKVIASISKALDDHELIKINILENAGLSRQDASENLATSLKATVVQNIGRKILLFKRNTKEPKIQIPVSK